MDIEDVRLEGLEQAELVAKLFEELGGVLEDVALGEATVKEADKKFKELKGAVKTAGKLVKQYEKLLKESVQ